MKRATFPFYLGEKAGEYSICYATSLRGLIKLFPKYALEGHKDAFSPENIYEIFLEITKEYLEETLDEMSRYFCEDIIQNTTNPIDKISGRDISQILISIKSNILNEQPVAAEDVNILHGYLFSEDKNNYEKCMKLLPWLGFDLEELTNCFSKSDLIDNSSKAQECLRTIATKGIRWYTKISIEQGTKTLMIFEIKNIRLYIERFCIFIKLVSVLSKKNTEAYQFDLITTLLEAAYLDGKAVREYEIYSEESLEAMHSRAPSFNRNQTEKPKKDLLSIVEDFVDKEYTNGSTLKTNQMIQLVMAKSEFYGLRKDPIETIVRSVKKKHGIDDRKNNRFANSKDKRTKGD
jgi:hypothetical protein